MIQARRFTRIPGLLCFFCFLFLLQMVLPLRQAWAGRPPPFTPLAVPELTKNAKPAKPGPSYPGAPVVQSITPEFGLRHGWTQIDVRGSNFQKGLKLFIGGKEAEGLKVVSDTHLRARTPENTFIGSADVVVQNPDGKTGTLLNGFLYEGSIFEVPGYNVPPDWNTITYIKLADMNNDGKNDFLMAAPWTPVEEEEFGNVLIYLQGPDRDGDGVPNFERVRRNKALNDTRSKYSTLAVGDLDRDGDLDFVAAGYNILHYYHEFKKQNQINRVYLNDGQCNFQVKDLPGNDPTGSVEIGDVNGDGNPDIVVANLASQSQLFFGDGKGNFRNVTQTHMPNAVLWTRHIHLVDVDGDRDLDAVLANTSDRKQQGTPNLLYINDGQGRFRNETVERKFPSGNQRAFKVASADIDRDGDMDLVFANEGENQLLINDGKGQFRATPMPECKVKDRYTRVPKDISRSQNFHVVFSDINVDGYPDLAVCADRASLMLYINASDGRGGRTFRAREDLIEPRPSGHGADMIELGDVNGDGKPDLTIASGNEQTPLWINDWPKGFRFATCNLKLNLPYTEWVTRSCCISDLNGDGKADIAMGQRYEPDVILMIHGRDGWYRRDFIDPSAVQPGKTVVEDIEAVDVDGDGDQDIVLGRRGEPSVLLLNDGKGNLTNAKGGRALPQTPMGTSEILPVDVDLDGDMDLFMCNWERALLGGRGQKNSLFINEGQGRFVDRTDASLPNEKCTARGGDVADINGDGYPDVVLACMRPNMLGGPAPNRVYMNQGKQAPGRFVNASHLLPPNNARSTDAAFCDVDGDGRLDIVFSNEVDLLKGVGGEDNLFHMKQDGSFEDWSNHLPKINRITWEVRILDFNRDRAPDIFSNRAYFNYDAGYGPKAEYGRHLLQGNDGKGNFSLPTVRQFDYIDQELHSWCGSCVGDLNEDGYPEIVQAVDGQVRIHQTFLRTKAVAHPVYAEVSRGQATQFDALSTHFPWGVEAKSVEWQFGDGQKASGQTVSHKYTKGGNYTVTLKVTDTAGYTDTDRVKVIVK